MNLNTNQVNYGLITENNVLINICKNGWTADALVYLTYNDGTLVVVMMFIRTLESKIYKA